MSRPQAVPHHVSLRPPSSSHHRHAPPSNPLQQPLLLHHSAAATAGEDLEMRDMRPAYARRGAAAAAAAGGGGGSGGGGGADEVYIWHQVEPHHTLRGIALQYRVTASERALFGIFFGDFVRF